MRVAFWAIVGLVAGVGLTFLAYYLTEDTPQNPGAKAATMFFMLVLVPLGAYYGAKFGARR
jgi:hypothetical protein